MLRGMRMDNKQNYRLNESNCKHSGRSEKYPDMNYCNTYCKFLDSRYEVCNFCEYFEPRK